MERRGACRATCIALGDLLSLVDVQSDDNDSRIPSRRARSADPAARLPSPLCENRGFCGTEVGRSVSRRRRRRSLSAKERFDLLQDAGFRCFYCGASAPDVELHIDHVRPLALGGENESWNLVVACRSCNIGKGARLFIGEAEADHVYCAFHDAHLEISRAMESVRGGKDPYAHLEAAAFILRSGAKVIGWESTFDE